MNNEYKKKEDCKNWVLLCWFSGADREPCPSLSSTIINLRSLLGLRLGYRSMDTSEVWELFNPEGMGRL